MKNPHSIIIKRIFDWEEKILMCFQKICDFVAKKIKKETANIILYSIFWGLSIATSIIVILNGKNVAYNSFVPVAIIALGGYAFMVLNTNFRSRRVSFLIDLSKVEALKVIRLILMTLVFFYTLFLFFEIMHIIFKDKNNFIIILFNWLLFLFTTTAMYFAFCKRPEK